MTVICWDPNTDTIYVDTARSATPPDRAIARRYDSVKTHDLTDCEFEGERYIVAAQTGLVNTSEGMVRLIRQYGIDETVKKLEAAYIVRNVVGRNAALGARARVLVITDKRAITLNFFGEIKECSAHALTFLGSGAGHCQAYTDLGMPVTEAIQLTSTVVPSVGPLVARTELNREQATIVGSTLITPSSKTSLQKDLNAALKTMRARVKELPRDKPKRSLRRS